MSKDKFQWKSSDLEFDEPVSKSKLHVIHYASDSDLPSSIRDKVPDSVGQSLFRHALNEALAHGKSEMHGFIAAYRALESAGYIRDADDVWIVKSGGPCGVLLPGEVDSSTEDYVSRPQVLSTDTEDDIAAYMDYLEGLSKSNPTLQQTHVDSPGAELDPLTVAGSKNRKSKDSEDDDDDEVKKDWVTINGQHLFIGSDKLAKASVIPWATSKYGSTKNAVKAHADAIKAISSDLKRTSGAEAGSLKSQIDRHQAEIDRLSGTSSETAKPSTSTEAAKPSEAKPSTSTSNGIPSKVQFIGSKKDEEKVSAVISQIPSKAFADSSLRSIKVSTTSIDNPTLEAGDLVGHMDHGTLNLYPGYDKNVVLHEFGHSLQSPKMLASYASHLSSLGVKPRGGYGTKDSALKESFANSFASYVNNGSHGFWDKQYGAIKKSEEEKEDDPGTQFIDPEQVEILGATIQNPADDRNKIAKRISGQSDIHLNKEGEALAAKLGVCIANKGCLDVLYSSPLNRGKETAHEILEACPHTTYASPNQALQPWHLGAFEGHSGEDTSDGIGHYVDNPDERPPGEGCDDKPAETFNESKTRQLTFWKNLYDDWSSDPTLKIGAVCHSRGLSLLQAWIKADCPDDFDFDVKDIKDPDDIEHASVYRWHKDEIQEIDIEDDDPLKPGIYPILHSLTDDDCDDGNEDLHKGGPGSGRQSIVGKIDQIYLPPIEVQRAAKSAYDLGCAVIGITDPLSDGTGLNETGIHEIVKHFDAVESATDTETTRNAWGGSCAHKWAQRVIKKIQRDYPQWIGVDLDGTLARPLESYAGNRIGDPIEGKFFDKVKQAVAEGKRIRILTARVADDPDGKTADAIKAWTLKHLGKELPVTNQKDPGMTELWDDKAHTPDEVDKGGPGSGPRPSGAGKKIVSKQGPGVMVAFTLDPETADKLKVEDGEDPSEMHVTLVYLGKEVKDDQIEDLTTMLKGFAATFAPIDVTLAGPIRFAASASSDDKDVCVASVESQTLHKFREDLLNKVESLGIEVKKNFSYNPHVTLKYIGKDDHMPVQRIEPIQVTFKEITLYVQGKTTDFPLSGTAIAKSTGYGTVIEAVESEDYTWIHVSCDDGNRVALYLDQYDGVSKPNNPIQIGDRVQWDDNELILDDGQELMLVVVDKATGSKEGQWITVNGQHILVGVDGKPLSGNPKVLGQRKVSAKVERSRKNAVLTGKHEQDIADRSEKKLSTALGIPRTKNNSAFDLRNDDVGIEVKTMTHGKNDKITMGKEAMGRKLAEQRADGLKVFTVIADMRGRTQAKYYVRDGIGSFRIGSMTPVSLSDLKEMVKM